MCSGRHLCSKFTQLNITLTRQMFGIIKLLPREQPQWIMYRVEYVRITSISNTFLMPILKNLIMLITNRKFETEDWEFKLILKQRYIPLRSRWNFFCLNFFFFLFFYFLFFVKIYIEYLTSVVSIWISTRNNKVNTLEPGGNDTFQVNIISSSSANFDMFTLSPI